MSKRKYNEDTELSDSKSGEEVSINPTEDILVATESFDSIADAEDTITYLYESPTISVSNTYNADDRVTYRDKRTFLTVGIYQDVIDNGFEVIGLYK